MPNTQDSGAKRVLEEREQRRAAAITMAEPAQEAAPPPGEDTQAQQPALPTEHGAEPSPAAAAADPTTQVDKELEEALRAALAGPGKDLGLLCKTLGDKFCLEPRRSSREDSQAGGDSGSDTTSPTDQEHSSSETDGDIGSASGSGGGSSSTAERDRREDDLQAVSAAAKVRGESSLYIPAESCEPCIAAAAQMLGFSDERVAFRAQHVVSKMALVLTPVRTSTWRGHRRVYEARVVTRVWLVWRYRRIKCKVRLHSYAVPPGRSQESTYLHHMFFFANPTCRIRCI